MRCFTDSEPAPCLGIPKPNARANKPHDTSFHRGLAKAGSTITSSDTETARLAHGLCHSLVEASPRQQLVNTTNVVASSRPTGDQYCLFIRRTSFASSTPQGCACEILLVAVAPSCAVNVKDHQGIISAVGGPKRLGAGCRRPSAPSTRSCPLATVLEGGVGCLFVTASVTQILSTNWF